MLVAVPMICSYGSEPVAEHKIIFLQHNASSGIVVIPMAIASSGLNDLFLQLRASSRTSGDFPKAQCQKRNSRDSYSILPVAE